MILFRERRSERKKRLRGVSESVTERVEEREKERERKRGKACSIHRNYTKKSREDPLRTERHPTGVTNRFLSEEIIPRTKRRRSESSSR